MLSNDPFHGKNLKNSHWAVPSCGSVPKFSRYMRRLFSEVHRGVFE